MPGAIWKDPLQIVRLTLDQLDRLKPLLAAKEHPILAALDDGETEQTAVIVDLRFQIRCRDGGVPEPFDLDHDRSLLSRNPVRVVGPSLSAVVPAKAGTQ